MHQQTLCLKCLNWSSGRTCLSCAIVKPDDAPRRSALTVADEEAAAAAAASELDVAAQADRHDEAFRCRRCGSTSLSVRDGPVVTPFTYMRGLLTLGLASFTKDPDIIVTCCSCGDRQVF